jgi:hypothetical protein
MKTKIYSFAFFVLILPCTVILSTCKKNNPSNDAPCDPIKDIYYYLRSDDRSAIPYHSLNDSIKLMYNGSGLKKYYFVSNRLDTGYVVHQSTNGDCPADKNHWQYINQYFTDTTYPNSLVVIQGCFLGYTSVLFDDKEFSTYTSAFRAPYDIDQMFINGKNYTNIEKLTEYQGDTNEYVLFNTTEGVLQIVSNGKTWYRLPY